MEKARILIAEKLADEGRRLLEPEFQVDVRPGLAPADLVRVIPQYDALIVRSATQVTAEVIAAGQRLRVIGRAGVGVNNIDVAAATARGIVVLNVPDGNTIAAAEHTVGLMLAVARHIPQAHASLQAGRWQRSAFEGVELRGKTLGVVGAGRIGQEVGKRCLAFGMRVLAYDPYANAETLKNLGIEQVASLSELLAQADFLTVHTPLTAQTRGLIGAAELAQMKKGSYVVNCARGGIIDEEALYQALVEGHLAGAALDVYSKEPPGDMPLLSLPQVVATPHLGASTREAQLVNAVEVAQQVGRFLRGQPVRNAVNLPALSERQWEQVNPLLPLAEVLGHFYTQAVGGNLNEVEVAYFGDADGAAVDFLASAVVKGLLWQVVSEPINEVNAMAAAQRQGVKVAVTRSHPRFDLPQPYLEVRVGREPRQHRVGGTLSRFGQPRITLVDGLPVDVSPTPYLIVSRHQDRPGIIGKFGTILGNAGINIAAMQVGRKQVRGEAIMILAVDDAVPAGVLRELQAIPGVGDALLVTLPANLVGAAAGSGPAQGLASA
ncbi:MAG: phosphoglycerate dehydrogenase [Firmicutes bacterium]|nr:phosphoglycerate dehydrogenase [Bacillota bacterium]